MTDRWFLHRGAGLLCAIDGVVLLRLGLLHVIKCVVNGAMHCGEFSSMWFVAMMCVYTALRLFNGIHRCVHVCFCSCGCRAGV